MNEFVVLTSENKVKTLENAKSGNTAALTEIYNQFFEPIYRFVYFRVGHKETAEDLAEEVFIKAFKKIASVKSPETLSAWLYMIARNTIIDHYRKSSIQVALEEVENLLEYEDNIAETLDTATNSQIIIIKLKELPREQRLVLQMKFFEDLDNKTISEVLGKKEGAIRVIQHRALTKLKELLVNIL